MDNATEIAHRRLAQPPHDAPGVRPDAADVYSARLYGGTVTAVPSVVDQSGQRLPEGQYLWTVSVETGDGRKAQVQARLTGQFGAEQLTPDSYVKQALDARLQTAELKPEGSEDTPLWRQLAGTAAPDFFVLGGKLPFREAMPPMLRFKDAALVMIEPKYLDFDLAGDSKPDEKLNFLIFEPDNRPGESERLLGREWQPVTAQSVVPFNPDSERVITQERGWGTAGSFGGERKGRGGWEVGWAFNVRASDLTLGSHLDGVSANFTLTGEKVLAKLLTDVIGGGKGKVGRSSEVLGRMLQAGIDTADFTGGLAWQGKLSHDERTGELLVRFGEFEVPVTELLSAADKLMEPRNHGVREIAKANNVEAYFRGENPFDRAVQTRDHGTFVNHGDPVADIAARLIRIGQITGIDLPHSDYVRSNADAQRALEKGLEMFERWPVSKEAREHLAEAPYGTGLDTEVPRFTPEEHERFRTTMALLYHYGVHGLYGEEVKYAATEMWVATPDLPEPQLDPGFVQDVFEGRFRDIEADTPWHENLLSLLNLVPGVGDMIEAWELGSTFGRILAMIEYGLPVDQDELRAHNEGANQVLKAHVEHRHEGGLEGALGVEGLTEAQAGVALWVLSEYITAEHIPEDVELTGRSLSQGFDRMSDAELRGIGEWVADHYDL